MYQDVTSDLQQRQTWGFFSPSLAWKTVSELFATACMTFTTKIFLYYCYLEKRPPLAHRALLALVVIGSWSSSALPPCPLCSHCLRCHHQQSNKAKATSAFSASLFTLMTSCRSEHTQLHTYRTSCTCTHVAAPQLHTGHQAPKHMLKKKSQFRVQQWNGARVWDILHSDTGT